MAYDPDYEAFLVRHRREMNELQGRINIAVAASRAPAKPMTPEARLARFVEILQEEFDKAGTPPPPAVGRVGLSGVDRLAQRLLAERGVQSVRSATPDQYRKAVRDVLEQLQNGKLSPADLGYRGRY
jgi:hypothetical protein